MTTDRAIKIYKEVLDRLPHLAQPCNQDAVIASVASAVIVAEEVREVGRTLREAINEHF
jgi:hypothetical protein